MVKLLCTTVPTITTYSRLVGHVDGNRPSAAAAGSRAVRDCLTGVFCPLYIHVRTTEEVAEGCFCDVSLPQMYDT